MNLSNNLFDAPATATGLNPSRPSHSTLKPSKFKPVESTMAKAKTSRLSLFLVALLILSISGIIFSFNYKSSLNEDDHKYSHLSGNLRTHIIEAIKYSNESDHGQTKTFNQLLKTKKSFSDTLKQLAPGSSETSLANLQSVNNLWREQQKNINTILGAEKSIRLSKKNIHTVLSLMPAIVSSSEQLISDITRRQPEPNLILTSSRQLILAQRIVTNTNLVTQQNGDTKAHIKTLSADANEFHNALGSMLTGNSKQGISKVKRATLRNEIDELIFAFETIKELISRINQNSARLIQARLATDNILHNSDKLLTTVNTLIDGYRAQTPEHQKINTLIYSLEALAVIILITLIFLFNKKTRYLLVNEEERNKQTTDAIIKLQNEIAPIANGDLTIQASVEPGITESISKTMNISINALRQLVRNIDIMTVQVSLTAEETQATAIHLSSASDTQAQQLNGVTNNMNKMVESFQGVAKQASESSRLANKAVEMAERGGQTVRNTLNAMQTISNDIYDASNRIKRLGESSQEIGNIVELINDIADQTNILALNAAIKASVAGESGQNFTVVADEVQQLAERVTQATKKIESLVNSIQLDTSQAVISMEQCNTDVLHGSKLASTAGDALLQIETVTAHLADFINNVSEATITLTTTSKTISQAMNNIKEVTDHKLAGTKQTAMLTGKLAELANVQKATVKGFKLPESRS